MYCVMYPLFRGHLSSALYLYPLPSAASFFFISTFKIQLFINALQEINTHIWFSKFYAVPLLPTNEIGTGPGLQVEVRESHFFVGSAKNIRS